VQEGERRDGAGGEVQLLRHDLLHAAEVGGGEAALADADELVHGGQRGVGSAALRRQVQAAQAHAGQVLRLHLGNGQAEGPVRRGPGGGLADARL